MGKKTSKKQLSKKNKLKKEKTRIPDENCYNTNIILISKYKKLSIKKRNIFSLKKSQENNTLMNPQKELEDNETLSKNLSMEDHERKVENEEEIQSLEKLMEKNVLNENLVFSNEKNSNYTSDNMGNDSFLFIGFSQNNPEKNCSKDINFKETCLVQSDPPKNEK